MYCSPLQVALALDPGIQSIVAALTGVTHLYTNFYESKIHPPLHTVTKSPSGHFAHNDFNWRDWMNECWIDRNHDLFVQLIFPITPLDGIKKHRAFMVWSGLHYPVNYLWLVDTLDDHICNLPLAVIYLVYFEDVPVGSHP